MSDTERDTSATDSPTEGLALLRGPDLQPLTYTTPEGAESAFGVIRGQVDRMALTEGPNRALAEAIAHERMMLVRADQLRAYGQGGEAVAAHRRFADDEMATATALFDYASGKTELTDEVRDTLQDRVNDINAELDVLGDDFSHETITELRGATDKLELHRLEAEYRELARVRSGDEELVPAAPEGQSESTTPSADQQATERQTAVEAARHQVESATESSDLRVRERQLWAYERDNFAKFELNQQKLDRLRAFLQAKVALEQAKQQEADPNGRRADTVAAVLGTGGEACVFLTNYMSLLPEVGGEITSVEQVLAMPFSRVVEAYLEMDVRVTNPGYFDTFREPPPAAR